MKGILFCLVTLFGSVAFASGDIFIMPSESLDRGTSYGSLGLEVNQPAWKKLSYHSWSALGDDVIYDASKRLEWFETRQGVQYGFKKFSVEGGYNLHVIWGVPGLAAHDNGVYARLNYHAW